MHAEDTAVNKRWLLVKNPPASAGDTGLILGWEDPLEEEMATHSSILAREIPWTEEPGGLQSVGVTKNQTRLSDSTAAISYAEDTTVNER